MILSLACERMERRIFTYVKLKNVFSFSCILVCGLAMHWMVSALRNVARWPAYQIRVAMARYAKRSMIMRLMMMLHRMAMRLQQSVNVAKNGNANVQMDIWGQRAKYPCVKITLVSMGRHVSIFQEAVCCAYVRWERTAITASTVSILIFGSCYSCIEISWNVLLMLHQNIDPCYGGGTGNTDG